MTLLSRTFADIKDAVDVPTPPAFQALSYVMFPKDHDYKKSLKKLIDNAPEDMAGRDENTIKWWRELRIACGAETQDTFDVQIGVGELVEEQKKKVSNNINKITQDENLSKDKTLQKMIELFDKIMQSDAELKEIFAKQQQIGERLGKALEMLNEFGIKKERFSNSLKPKGGSTADATTPAKAAKTPAPSATAAKTPAAVAAPTATATTPAEKPQKRNSKGGQPEELLSVAEKVRKLNNSGVSEGIISRRSNVRQDIITEGLTADVLSKIVGMFSSPQLTLLLAKNRLSEKNTKKLAKSVVYNVLLKVSERNYKILEGKGISRKQLIRAYRNRNKDNASIEILNKAREALGKQATTQTPKTGSTENKKPENTKQVNLEEEKITILESLSEIQNMDVTLTLLNMTTQFFNHVVQISHITSKYKNFGAALIAKFISETTAYKTINGMVKEGYYTEGEGEDKLKTELYDNYIIEKLEEHQFKYEKVIEIKGVVERTIIQNEIEDLENSEVTKNDSENSDNKNKKESRANVISSIKDENDKLKNLKINDSTKIKQLINYFFTTLESISEKINGKNAEYKMSDDNLEGLIKFIEGTTAYKVINEIVTDKKYEHGDKDNGEGKVFKIPRDFIAEQLTKTKFESITVKALKGVVLKAMGEDIKKEVDKLISSQNMKNFGVEQDNLDTGDENVGDSALEPDEDEELIGVKPKKVKTAQPDGKTGLIKEEPIEKKKPTTPGAVIYRKMMSAAKNSKNPVGAAEAVLSKYESMGIPEASIVRRMFERSSIYNN